MGGAGSHRRGGTLTSSCYILKHFFEFRRTARARGPSAGPARAVGCVAHRSARGWAAFAPTLLPSDGPLLHRAAAALPRNRDAALGVDARAARRQLDVVSCDRMRTAPFSTAPLLGAFCSHRRRTAAFTPALHCSEPRPRAICSLRGVACRNHGCLFCTFGLHGGLSQNGRLAPSSALLASGRPHGAALLLLRLPCGTHCSRVHLSCDWLVHPRRRRRR